MNSKTVDASVVVAILFMEPEGEELASQLADALLLAPAVIEYEVGNACWKKCRRHRTQAPALRARLLALRDLNLQLHDVDPAETLDLSS